MANQNLQDAAKAMPRGKSINNYIKIQEDLKSISSHFRNQKIQKAKSWQKEGYNKDQSKKK